jgi:hypothetical protein
MNKIFVVIFLNTKGIKFFFIKNYIYFCKKLIFKK